MSDQGNPHTLCTRIAWVVKVLYRAYFKVTPTQPVTVRLQTLGGCLKDAKEIDHHMLG